MNKLKDFLYINKYEILLIGLIQHLFIGVLFPDLSGNLKIVWILNIIFFGLYNYWNFHSKGKKKKPNQKCPVVFGCLNHIRNPFYP